ncbi:MAG: CpXC domain-containing protein [Elusimicrobiota bacterium]
MAIKGLVSAQCPGKGCESVEVEVWSYIRGDRDAALRESLLAGDLNFVRCETCGSMFSPEATVVYYDPSRMLLAFIFPESYRGEEERWRGKMSEDYSKMRSILGTEVLTAGEPLLFFGLAEASRQMNDEEDLEDEVKVAEYLCGELGLKVRSVERSYARLRDLPRILPYAPPAKSGEAAREDVLAGLMRLLKANDRLAGFRRWLALLGESDVLPPVGRENVA